MAFGSFVMMLHSHLPYYRKHGMWPFGEENIYECMAETYLPLLVALTELQEEGVKAHLTLGLTPILVEQLADPHIKDGFSRYLETLLNAAKADIQRYPDPEVPHSEHLAFLAKWYVDHFQQLTDHYNRFDRDLIAGFKALQDAGCIEITTSAATHGFNPLLDTDESINAQFRVGVDTYKRHFGVEPKGAWLPECAYRPATKETDENGNIVIRPSIDAFLYENNIKYFFTEYHAIEGGASSGSRRQIGVYGNIEYIPLPARPKTGLSTYEAYWMKDYPVAVLGRNDRASFQVWSAAHGYPGDGLYREFHKKDSRSGLQYWRITSKDTDLGDKMLYDPVLAFNQTGGQADHFSHLIYDLMKAYHDNNKREGLCMVSFDTELFGHWWFEGIAWIKQVIRNINKMDGVDFLTASEYLEKHPPETAIELPESTWGQGGHYWVWQNHQTDWMWPIIHSAENKMSELVQSYREENDPLKVRLLNQVLRELFLMESSDWPFLVTTFQAKDYAIERFNEHKDRFWALIAMLDSGNIDEARLAHFEDEDNPFPELDFRWYQFEKRAVHEVAMV